MKKADGLSLALNRINFKAETLPLSHFKNLINDLIGKRAVALGIVQETSKDVYDATGEEFPKDKIDFLIFYKLLLILCKLCIAKHDERKILDRLNKHQKIADVSK